MRPFDTVIVVDWSARSAPSPAKPSSDAIWIGVATGKGVRTHYLRTRAAAFEFLFEELTKGLDRGDRILAGFDFPFGYPAGFAETLTGHSSAFEIWAWLAARIVDTPENANNRFDVAERINASMPGIGPFWGCPTRRATVDLPERASARKDHGMAERRAVEGVIPTAQPVWKLYTTGSVGSQSLLGIPHLDRLKRHFRQDCSVWPFEPPTARIVFAEVYPSLLSRLVDTELRRDSTAIKDEVQVRLLARALAAASQTGDLEQMFDLSGHDTAAEEGWILGAGHEEVLREAAARPLAPPPLRDDCFTLPAGVDWLPVEKALELLSGGLSRVTDGALVPIAQAGGRILAEGPVALRCHPPAANSAVDGYCLAHSSLGTPPHALPLFGGRAAAGAPFEGALPEGFALRILTGAVLPAGADTVVLEEDTSSDAGQIAFNGPVRPGANTRKAGEDVTAGATVLPARRMLRPHDLALLASAGLSEVPVCETLRVGVLSTGDELREPGDAREDGTIPDANRPMLIEICKRWGYETVDLGIAGDDVGKVRERLDTAARNVHAIVTSGGASAGDEDHVSALLRSEGTVQAWRIALKPGRPLLLGQWKGVPVFGLPGNPVAAFVCTLLFARPAFSVLAGGEWTSPTGFNVPAAFAKNKKPGRKEYLRARLNEDGAAEVFASEGSGRVSGLSWSDGLVEIGMEARTVNPGDQVRYIPYSSFGL